MPTASARWGTLTVPCVWFLNKIEWTENCLSVSEAPYTYFHNIYLSLFQTSLPPPMLNHRPHTSTFGQISHKVLKPEKKGGVSGRGGREEGREGRKKGRKENFCSGHLKELKTHIYLCITAILLVCTSTEISKSPCWWRRERIRIIKTHWLIQKSFKVKIH